VHEHVRRLGDDLLRARRELIEPLRPAAQHLHAEQPEVRPVLPLALLGLAWQEDDLHLLDIVAVEEQFDAAEDRLAPVDLDERAAGLGGETGGGGGKDEDAEYAHGCGSDRVEQ
jgi:hypothetical protein